MAAVVVDAVVERPQRPLDAHAHEQRAQTREQRARRPGEEDDEEQDGAEHERSLEPEVGADVVAADCEHEPDRPEQHRGGAAEPPLDEDDRGEVAGAARVPLGGLEDPHRVAADGRRQDLAGGVRDEVRARQPPEMLDDPLRRQQPAPPHRHGQSGHDHDRDRQGEPPEVGRREDVPRLLDVDLEEDVRDRQRRQREPDRDPHGSPHVGEARYLGRPHAENRACARRTASTASRMSSSEWAGESGNESTSPPARSATGSGAWAG